MKTGDFLAMTILILLLPFLDWRRTGKPRGTPRKTGRKANNDKEK